MGGMRRDLAMELVTTRDRELHAFDNYNFRIYVDISQKL
jgi:hypothetical protein